MTRAKEARTALAASHVIRSSPVRSPRRTNPTAATMKSTATESCIRNRTEELAMWMWLDAGAAGSIPSGSLRSSSDTKTPAIRYAARTSAHVFPAVSRGRDKARPGAKAARHRAPAPPAAPMSDIQAENRTGSPLRSAHGSAEKTKLAQASRPRAVVSARSSERRVPRNRERARYAARSKTIATAVSIVACRVALR